MAYLACGLMLFLGVLSIRICAENWRNARIAAIGQPLPKVVAAQWCVSPAK